MYAPRSLKLFAHIAYRIAGIFQGRKLSRFGGNKIFTKKTSTDYSPVSPPKDAMPLNFGEKAFTNSYKTLKFAKVFSLESFPLYGITFHIR